MKHAPANQKNIDTLDQWGGIETLIENINTSNQPQVLIGATSEVVLVPPDLWDELYEDHLAYRYGSM